MDDFIVIEQLKAELDKWQKRAFEYLGKWQECDLKLERQLRVAMDHDVPPGERDTMFKVVVFVIGLVSGACGACLMKLSNF